MHTDEYEISLSRELEVCRRYILKIKKALRGFEGKYKIPTEEFLKRYNGGELPGSEGDFIVWVEKHEALKRWEERLREFERIYRQMKL